LARLCVVTSTSKKVKGKGDMVGLLPIPGDGSALDTKMSGHTNNSKFVRNFGTLIKNKLIVNSQRHRKDFQTVVEQVDLAEKYLTNHVGLETIPAEEVKTFREFLSMGTWDQCIYLEGLRRLKKGLDKQIPKRGDSFDESLEREGIYNVDSDDKEVVDEEDEDETEEALVEKNAIHIDMDESYLETLDQEMKDLVAPLSKNWPLEWMKTKSEISKLKRIMTRKKNCRRHEMFMDSKQRNVRNNLPELLKMSNNSFMNIFGKKRESIDRDIRIYLLENVFNKTKISKEFDPRLTTLLAQSLDHGRQYIELVLYPELFISWLSVTRNCRYLEADRFYQTVGQVVSQKEIDRLAEEWLQGGKRSPVFNSDSESEDS